MKRPIASAGNGQSVLASQDPMAWAEMPGWRSFFLDTKYDDGDTAREPGTLIVRAEASRWVLTLKDPTFCTQLLVSGPTWDEAILMAESLLCDDRAPWVPDPWAQKRRRK